MVNKRNMYPKIGCCTINTIVMFVTVMNETRKTFQIKGKMFLITQTMLKLNRKLSPANVQMDYGYFKFYLLFYLF